MSPPGRPKGEFRSAQHEGIPASPPGRPKGEFRSAQHEGIPASPPGRPKGEFRSAQHGGIPANPPGRPKGEFRSAQHEGFPASPPGRPKISVLLGSEIVALSESARTESVWLRTRIVDGISRALVGEMILNSATLKASYAAYDREAQALGRSA